MKLIDGHTDQRYEAGDRILVKLAMPKSAQENKGIVQIVQKFCKADVAVLVVSHGVGLIWISNQLGVAVRAIIEPHTKITVGGKEHPNVAHLNCTKIVFNPGDVLHWFPSAKLTRNQIQQFKPYLVEWLGVGFDLTVYGEKGN